MIPYRGNPLGYTPYLRKVSYLCGTGTQYINTGYRIPDNGFGSIYIDFGTPSEINNYVYYFGASSNGILTLFQQSYVTNKNYQIFMGTWDGSDTHNKAGAVGGRDHLKVDYQYGDGVNTSTVTWSDGTTSTDTTEYSFHGGILFLFRSGSGQTAAGVPVKIYNFKIRENGILVHDFIPVLDKALVPCMFDSVTRTMFYNAGSGTFTYE